MSKNASNQYDSVLSRWMCHIVILLRPECEVFYVQLGAIQHLPLHLVWVVPAFALLFFKFH